MMEFVPSAYTSLGLLGASCGLLALRMSLYRLAGSPGESKPDSPMNKFYELQLLHAEWAPVGAFLSLALLQMGVARPTVDLWTFLFVASRLGFAAARLGPGRPFSTISMVVSYVATAGLSYHLIAGK